MLTAIFQSRTQARQTTSRRTPRSSALLGAFAVAAMTVLAGNVAQAATGDDLLTNAQYNTSCGLSNFETSLSTCAGPLATWRQLKWGTSTTQFSIVQETSTNKAAYLSVSKYRNGAALWQHSPVAVKPSTMYRYNVRAKTGSTTTAWAEVEFRLQNGNYRYLPLSAIGPSTSWSKFTDDFYTPSDVATATVYVYMKSNGNVTIDDVALIELAPPDNPSTDAYLNYSLNRPLVSISFDDGTSDILSNAVPLLDARGFKTTQFIIGGSVGTSGFFTINDLVNLNNAGHELGSHTWIHESLPTLSSTQLIYETTTTQSNLRAMVPSCVMSNAYGASEKCFDQFAYPFGDNNQKVLNQVKSSHRTGRGTEDGLNTLNINNVASASTQSMQAIYRLHSQIVLNANAGGGGVPELQGWLNNAKNSKSWLILLYHRVNGTPDEYGLTPSDFDAHLQAVKDSGLCVTPMHEALNEIAHQGQYAAKCGVAPIQLAAVGPSAVTSSATGPSQQQIKALNKGWDRGNGYDPRIYRQEHKQSRFGPR